MSFEKVDRFFGCSLFEMSRNVGPLYYSTNLQRHPFFHMSSGQTIGQIEINFTKSRDLFLKNVGRDNHEHRFFLLIFFLLRLLDCASICSIVSVLPEIYQT